jgi:hypothetical protein
MPLDPKLAPLGDYGGKTHTHALTAGSPAIQKGDIALAGSPDQRGTMRTPYFSPDPGAFQTAEALRFRLIAPAQVIAGQPFEMDVIAIDQWGNHATTYTGAVFFQATDEAAELPPNYPFIAADVGSATFTVTLRTEGTQAVKVKELSGFPFGATTIDVVQARAGDLAPLATSDEISSSTVKSRRITVSK